VGPLPTNYSLQIIVLWVFISYWSYIKVDQTIQPTHQIQTTFA